jgi:hypothetical protein
MSRRRVLADRRSRVIATGAALAAVALGVGPVPGATADPGFDNLEPGARASMSEEIPVQFVFVGYDDVDIDQFTAELPDSADPVARYPAFYGLEAGLGLHYTFDFTTSVASEAYEDQVFEYLADQAVPESQVDGQDITLFQEQYNAQETNRLDVENNQFIDGPSVEEWLVNNPAAGVDPERNTVYFLNWWGRDDFMFHTYTKFGEPDPDTGYDFGLNRQSRKMIAWGGTPSTDEETPVKVDGSAVDSRTWFYDLSAGPESWTDNWAVDIADLDGDGESDYRMPPIWEYRNDAGAGPGAHPKAALSSDLGLVARYVGLDLLFASSPLYSPALQAPRLPDTINLDVNGYEGLPGLNGTRDYFTPDLFLSEEQELVDIPMTIDVESAKLQKSTKNCLELQLKDHPCDPNKVYPGFANLYLDAAKRQPQWRDGGPGYEAGIFHYTTRAKKGYGPLGYADDNYRNGTQSGVFSFLDPDIINVFGYGLTTTDIHEVGHHLGMSHPHDGYDSESGVDFGGTGAFYFANSGDQSNSIMSYIDVNWDFSTFDRDNAARFYAATYVTTANTVAEMVLDAGSNAGANAALQAADTQIGLAEQELAAHDYAAAFSHAQAAYGHALDAAAAADVDVPATNDGWRVVQKVKGAFDLIDYSSIDMIGEDARRARP